MYSRISYTIVLICIYVCVQLTGPVRLFFSDYLPDSPQDLVEIGTGSLFYTGDLDHVSLFTCASDDTNDSVVWYDSFGCEVSTGDGGGNALYWTGTSWNKTMHTSNNSGHNLLNELNDGINFTCKVNGSNDFKVLGIYHISSLPDPKNASLPFNARGFRLFSNATPPTVYEFTLQRGSFSIDRGAISTVQSLLPANISFTPPPTNQDDLATAGSTINDLQFNTSSICQIVGQDLSDSVYIGFSDQPFLLVHADDFPTFSSSYCIRNGTVAYKYSIGMSSSFVRVDCPLPFNAEFINLNSLNIETSSNDNSFLARFRSERRRLWIDFTEQIPVTIKFEREYVCEDKYGMRVSFRVQVVANGSIEVYDSANSTRAALNGSSYVGSVNGIPSTLYCLSGVASTGVKWYRETQVNRSGSPSIELVESTGGGFPIAFSPRIGRSDLILNGTISSDAEGYYYCRDYGNLSLKFGIFSLPPVAPTAMIIPSSSSLQVIIGEYPQVLICRDPHAHPPPVSYWIGPLDAGTPYLDTGTLLEASSGKYTCVTTNVISSSTTDINIEVVPPPPRLITSQIDVEAIFSSNPFRILCEFSTYMNVTPAFAVEWYHNGKCLNLASINTTTDESRHTVESILSVPLSQSGHYTCVARVGRSGSTNATLHVPDVISLTASSVTYKRVTLSWNAVLPPPVYTIFYKRSSDTNFMTTSTSNTTLTLHDLAANTQYEVLINASNQFASLTFHTEPIRLFFRRNGDIVPFVSGSIFRGGGRQLKEAVTEFHCAPDSPSHMVTWYLPNGTEIPTGGVSTSGLYHSLDVSTGESTLHTMDGVTSESGGNNFTCVISSSSQQVLSRFYFGIYYAKPEDSGFNIFGIRLTDPDDLIYEFVYQNGVFDFNYSRTYNVECLGFVGKTHHWLFQPPLISSTNVSTLDQMLPNVKFDPTSSCQVVRCSPYVQYVVFSNQPFLLKSSPVVSRLSALKCIPDNAIEYTFKVGESLDMVVTCPLVFDGRFLNIPTYEFAPLDTRLSQDNPRRLWVNGSVTKAELSHEREYVCEDKYGTRVSFRVQVVANGSIEVYDSANSTRAALNGSSYVGSVNGIPSILYCLSGVSSTGVKWYRDTQVNRSGSPSIELVDSTGGGFPIAFSPRIGRSDLILNGTISLDAEGYYYCRDDGNLSLKFGIFSLPPVAPVASIFPNVSVLQIIISLHTPILSCTAANTPHPHPTASWYNPMGRGIINGSFLNTADFLENNSGFYTCTTSNFVGESSSNISLNVIPPRPILIGSTLTTSHPIYLKDTVALFCEFATFPNITSTINVFWYQNNSILILNSDSTQITEHRNDSTVRSVLTIRNSESSRSGSYNCISQVGASRTTNSSVIILTSEPPPQPTLDYFLLQNQHTIYYKTNFSFRCQFSTISKFLPHLMTEWYHNRTRITTSQDVQINEYHQTETMLSFLTISHSNYSHSGGYYCSGVILGANTTSQVISVSVIPFVLISSPGNLSPLQQVYIKGSLSLNCDFIILPIFASTVSIDWFHNGTILSPCCNSGITINTAINQRTGLVQGILDISAVDYCNAGEYHCIAQSLHANSSASDQHVVTFVTAPQQTVQNLRGKYISSQQAYVLEWTLSSPPTTGEMFTLEFTIMSSDNLVTSSQVELGCDAVCRNTSAVVYTLSNVEPDAQYLVKVTVSSEFGQSSQLATFRSLSHRTTTASSVAETSRILPTDTLSDNDCVSLTSLYFLIPIVLIVLMAFVCNLITCCVCRSRAKKQRHSHEQLPSMQMTVRQHPNNVFCNADDVLYSTESGESDRDELDAYTQESGFVFMDTPARAYDFTITHTL